MNIRPLTTADAHAFQALRLSALVESPSAFGASHEEECDRPLEQIADSLGPEAGRQLLGAWVEGHLVGIVAVGREGGLKERHRGFVRSMYVAPRHRGQGVGRQLLDLALALLRAMPGLHDVTLAVTAGNRAAIALYEAAGFVAYATTPDALLVDGMFYDEIGMRLKLGGAV